MTQQGETQKTPWHLWVVGLIGIPWNGYGAYDYLMTQTGGEEFLRSYGMNDAQVAYFNAIPAWMTGVWAIGVWGAVLGTVLLLLRRKSALHVFVGSFLAFLMSLVYTYLLSNGGEVMADGAIMSAVITAGCIFFIGYAWMMAKRGVLR